MATLQDITTLDWSLSVAQPGEIVQGAADVDQCIRIIMTTQKGSDPLRPLFGVDLLKYIDKPSTAIIPGLTAEIIEQISTYEPRAEIVSVVGKFVPPSTVEFTVTWRNQIFGLNTTTLNYG